MGPAGLLNDTSIVIAKAFHANERVPRHFGKSVHPQKSLPVFGPLRAVRRAIDDPHYRPPLRGPWPYLYYAHCGLAVQLRSLSPNWGRHLVRVIWSMLKQGRDYEIRSQ